jgi:hypothetical protein
MKPTEIKAELVRRNIKVTEIARRVECDPAQVTRCINGDGLYLRTREIIASAINKPVSQVFNRHHPKPKRSAKATASAA